MTRTERIGILVFMSVILVIAGLNWFYSFHNNSLTEENKELLRTEYLEKIKEDSLAREMKILKKKDKKVAKAKKAAKAKKTQEKEPRDFINDL